MSASSHASAVALLASLEPLSHPQRIRALVEHIREGVREGELRGLLDALAGQGAYGRGLAVVAAGVGGDRAWLGDRIGDPDPFVRTQALRAARSAGVPDEAFEAALQGAPEAVRRQLLRAVVGQGRVALADRLVAGVRRDWGDAEAARLLRGCSSGVVAELLPELFHAVTSWRTLAKRHPDALLDTLERELSALPARARTARWQELATPAAALATVRPAHVLGLLDRFSPESMPPRLHAHLPAFAAADAGAMLRLLLGLTDTNPFRRRVSAPSVLRRLLRSGAPEVPAYARTLAEDGQLPLGLRAVPPGQRAALYRQAVAGLGQGSVLVDSELLAELPRTAATEVARATATYARERGMHWESVLRAESFLPVAEVRERLVAATRRPSADDRAQAWPLLVDNARRSGDPEAVTAAVAEMARLRNEQDPVRSAALRALAATHPALFTSAAVPHLDRIVVDAVEVRDSSRDTRAALTRLALSVLREQAADGQRDLTDWALGAVVRICGTTGGADLGRLDERLCRGQEHLVYEALRPSIETSAAKADFGLALAFARAVGRRAHGMAALQDMLWQAIEAGSHATRRSAIELWLEAPATRAVRVERVLGLEPSAAALPCVYAVLARSRTDLLAHVLGEQPPYGRFLTPGASWTVPVGPWIRHWTPRQQALAQDQLTRTVADRSLPTDRRAAALTQLARIPDTGARLVLGWAGTHDVVVAETALAALARTDRPTEALPVLLAHTGTDRARVAVFAAAQVSREIGPQRLVGLLREVLLAPGAKVTSRKEAARLAAARLPVPAAAELLAEAYAQDGAHRDVKAACVSVAGGLLADERAWSLLTDATWGEPALQRAVLRTEPWQPAASHRARYARLIAQVRHTQDPDIANLAYLALGRWAPWLPDASDVLAQAVGDLSLRHQGPYATAGLVLTAQLPDAAHGLAHAMNLLVQADQDPHTDDAGEQRDRPARRRIEDLVRQLYNTTLNASAAIRPAALEAAELLLQHPEFRRDALTLLVDHMDLDVEEHELTRALLRLAALHEGRPVLTVGTAEVLKSRRLQMLDLNRPGAEAALLATARRLALHGGHAEGMIATAVVAGLGQRTGWPEAPRAALRELRRHPVADVRDAALTEITAHE